MPLNFEDIRPASAGKRTVPEIFEGIGESSIRKIFEHAILRRYSAGHLLLQQGESPNNLCLIISGTVKTMRTSVDGKEATIRMLKAGDTCMEAIIFMNASSPIAVQVMEDAQLLMIPDKIIKSLVLEDARFANNLLKI